MDRRAFIAAGAGALASSWLSGCGGGGGSAGTPVAPPPPGPSLGVYAPLASQMKGQLLVAGSTGFDAFRLPANARYDSVVPQALARCVAAEDVVAAVNFARANQIRFTPRSGGHSYLGASTIAAGLVIDTGPMDSVRIDGDIAVVSAGAKLADIYRALLALPQPRLLPSGSCPTVGISGIALGGGFGCFQRAHGLTCDALAGATLVTADGQTVSCDATRHPDLFWALRGGGGGMLGLVTELRLRTQPLPAMSSSTVQYGGNDIPAVLAAWQAWGAALPDSVWSQAQIGAFGNGQIGMQVIAVAADGAAALSAHWNRFLAATGATMVSNSPPLDAAPADLLLGRCATLSAAQCRLPSQSAGGTMTRVSMTASSDFFTALPTAGVQALVNALTARSQAGRFGGVLLDLMGGAIARVAKDATAFPHRDALFSAQYLTENMAGDLPAALDDNARWTHGLRDTMAPWSTGGAYVNYPDAAIPNPATAYYGENVARLREVQRSVDPNGLFKTPIVTI